MALGSSCFGLLFLGSGSTFGSTSPPLSGGAILPLYPSSFFAQLTQKASPGPAATLACQTKESPRTPVSDCRLLPSRRPPSDQHRDLGPGTASREKPNNLAPFPTGGSETEFEFRRRGTTFSEFPTEGFGRWQTPRRVHRRRLLVDGSRPTGRGNILGISGICPGEQYPISYYNELFVWNQACHRQPAHFHLIGAESKIGRRTPSVVQSDG